MMRDEGVEGIIVVVLQRIVSSHESFIRSIVRPHKYTVFRSVILYTP